MTSDTIIPEWEQALAGQGALFATLMAERTRLLAAPGLEGPRAGDEVLVCLGAHRRWGLPLAALARVETLPAWIPVPGWGGAVLGLVVVAGGRLLLADLDSLAEGLPPRLPGRGGVVLALRQGGLALAADAALDILRVPAAAVITADPSMPRFVRAWGEGGVAVLDVAAIVTFLLTERPGLLKERAG